MEPSPQVTTEPSSLMAAKADSVEKISVTPLERDEKTELEFPPYEPSPQVTTEPSSLMDGKG